MNVIERFIVKKAYPEIDFDAIMIIPVTSEIWELVLYAYVIENIKTVGGAKYLHYATMRFVRVEINSVDCLIYGVGSLKHGRQLYDFDIHDYHILDAG